MYNYVNHWSPSPSFYKPKSIHMILTIYFLILGFLLWQAILSWAHMSFCFCFAFVSEWIWRRRRKRSWIYFPSPSALSFFGVLRLLCQDQLGWFVFVFRLLTSVYGFFFKYGNWIWLRTWEKSGNLFGRFQRRESKRDSSGCCQSPTEV